MKPTVTELKTQKRCHPRHTTRRKSVVTDPRDSLRTSASLVPPEPVRWDLLAVRRVLALPPLVREGFVFAELLRILPREVVLHSLETVNMCEVFGVRLLRQSIHAVTQDLQFFLSLSVSFRYVFIPQSMHSRKKCSTENQTCVL